MSDVATKTVPAVKAAEAKETVAAGAAIRAQFAAGISVLLNNAGVMALPDARTTDGYDLQMQTNHFSPFLLVKELLPLLEQTGGRVVNHSSNAAQGSALEQKYFEQSKEDELGGIGGKWARYHQSKLGCNVFTNALADRLDKSGSKVIVAVAHPGFASTALLAKAGGEAKASQSAGDGACGILTCAFQEGVKSRDFWGPKGLAGAAILAPFTSEEMNKDSNKDMLWKASVAACGGDIAMKQ